MVNPDILVCNCSGIIYLKEGPTFNVHIRENCPSIGGANRFVDILFPGPVIERNYGFDDEEEKSNLIEYVWSNRHLLTIMAYEQGMIFMAPSQTEKI